jgi:hypothetical protein
MTSISDRVIRVVSITTFTVRVTGNAKFPAASVAV